MYLNPRNSSNIIVNHSAQVGDPFIKPSHCDFLPLLISVIGLCLSCGELYPFPSKSCYQTGLLSLQHRTSHPHQHLVRKHHCLSLCCCKNSVHYLPLKFSPWIGISRLTGWVWAQIYSQNSLPDFSLSLPVPLSFHKTAIVHWSSEVFHPEIVKKYSSQRRFYQSVPLRMLKNKL